MKVVYFPSISLVKCKLFSKFDLKLLAYGVLIKWACILNIEHSVLSLDLELPQSTIQTFWPLVFKDHFQEFSCDGGLKQNSNIFHSLSQILFLLPLFMVLFYSFIEVTLKKKTQQFSNLPASSGDQL